MLSSFLHPDSLTNGRLLRVLAGLGTLQYGGAWPDNTGTWARADNPGWLNVADMTTVHPRGGGCLV
jgi:hypothetical protein